MRGHLGQFCTEISSSTPISFRAAESTNATSTASFVVSKPTGTVDGDAMLAIVNANNDATITPPAGWTLIRSVNAATSATISTFYKIASSEGSDYTFTIGSSQRTSGGIVSFAPGSTFSSNFVDVSSSVTQNGTNSAYATAVTTTVTDTMIVYLSSYDDSNTGYVYTIASGYTQAFQTSGSSKSIVGYKAQVAAGTTGSIQTTISSETPTVGNFAVAIKQN